MKAKQASGSARPELRELTRREIDALLRRNSVGRLAFALHNVLTIEPLHYVYSKNWLYVRTSAGLKLEALGRAPWVAFEVDEIAGMFEWKSVVIRGTVHVLEPDGPEQTRAFNRGVAALRRLIPETFTSDDPIPFRQTVFAIYVHEASGRESRVRRAAPRTARKKK